MNELFEIEESKSPRLLWTEKHNIKTHYNKECDPPWAAFIGDWDDIGYECNEMEEDGRLVEGYTEEEALLNLIARGRVKHWNQE